MANAEHLAAFLKFTDWRHRYGATGNVKGWNEWASKASRVDLSGAQIHGRCLDTIWLVGANLSECELGASHAYHARLVGANLRNARLAHAEWSGSNFSNADLTGSDCSESFFKDTNFKEATLSDASFANSALDGALFQNCRLEGTRFGGSQWQGSILNAVDLSKCKGLSSVQHKGPSLIDLASLSLSKGQIPPSFLRGCGLSDWEIEVARLYDTSLTTQQVSEVLESAVTLRSSRPLQRRNIFISYSRKDAAFIDALEDELKDAGIRFWRDVHDATAGRLDANIEIGMRRNPVVLLVLSASSIDSDWVEHEATRAINLGKELDRDVLCPIALDDTWKDSTWSAMVLTQIRKYNVLSFQGWEDRQNLKRNFQRLINGLNLFYQ